MKSISYNTFVSLVKNSLIVKWRDLFPITGHCWTELSRQLFDVFLYFLLNLSCYSFVGLWFYVFTLGSYIKSRYVVIVTCSY